MDTKHHIETTEHDDGRKDVTVGITAVDVDPKDADDQKVVDHINDTVIPAATEQLRNQKVHVILLHVPTRGFSQLIIKRVELIPWVKAAIKAYPHQSTSDDFLVIVNDKPVEGATLQVGTGAEVIK